MKIPFMPNNEAAQQRQQQNDLMNFEIKRDSIASATDDMVQLQYQESKSDLRRWQQDLYDEIQNMVMDLKGYALDENGEWVAVRPPIMNTQGTQKFVSYLRPLTSRNLMNSNYDEDHIYRSLRDIVGKFILDIAYNYENYELDFGDFNHVLRMLKGYAEATHFRCLNDGERRHEREIVKRIETHADNQMPQKKGLFGMFRGS